jgi:hypothetical protein
MNDDNEFLSNLSSAQTSTVLIGFRSMDEVQLAHLIEEEGDDDDEDISDFDEEDGSNGGSSDDDLEDFDVQVSIYLPEQMCFSFHVQWYTSC